MQTLLERLNACNEAREWVGDRTLSEAWAECDDHPEWMLWLHTLSQSADHEAYSQLAKKWDSDAKKRAEQWAADWENARDYEGEMHAWRASLKRNVDSRVIQCNDIRAALCCPVFDNDND